jgi:hypothetical protein
LSALCGLLGIEFLLEFRISTPSRSTRELDPEGQKRFSAEAAAVGQNGLSINNPDQNLHLQHCRGGTTVSALAGRWH